MVEIKVINKSKYPIEYATNDSAGFDVHANIDSNIVLKPLERKLIPSGLFFELPSGYEAMVRPRSGLALKHGITVLNTPGTVDADYRGEVGIILINLGGEDYTIAPGERIAQIIINKFEKVEFKFVDNLSDTDRGDGGFGHTGK